MNYKENARHQKPTSTTGPSCLALYMTQNLKHQISQTTYNKSTSHLASTFTNVAWLETLAK